MSAPGWHGKLPSLGDFASRRLDARFLEPWDAWLSQGLAMLQAQPDWLDRYLQSPAWRFLLMPGVIDERTWSGVLMPSVDRVGRYYPFTLVATFEVPPALTQAAAHWAWLGQLEDLAFSALDREWSVDELEGRLNRLNPPEPDGESDSVPHSLQWHQGLRGKSCWYAAPAVGASKFLICERLDSNDLPRTLFAPAAPETAGTPAASNDLPRIDHPSAGEGGDRRSLQPSTTTSQEPPCRNPPSISSTTSGPKP
ncbi:type VI secretion system-associated protein TagF [Ramlibacter aurantiacus]|uniref:type VI secretion system-associated protein TagF n=1 Tax=Ramlibacter aurantiacus TaxID=2801330 RepID=UPI00338D601D